MVRRGGATFALARPRTAAAAVVALALARPRTAAAAVVALGVAGCGGAGAPAPAPATSGRLLTDAPRAGALAVTPAGTLLTGALERGEIAAVPPLARSLPRLRVATGGQRGLLGLAAGRGGRIYASYTRAGDRRIVVERIAPGPRTRIWTGPPSTTLANGGHLALAPDGRLVIGIGDLQDAARTADPAAPNGKLLALRTDGAGNAHPAVLSHGWNNPFAFVFTPDGTLWVADNSPGRRAERLARGDGGGAPHEVSELGRKTAPSGVAAISNSELAVCGFVSGTLDRYRRTQGRWRLAGTIARGCRYGVVALPDGRLAFSTGRDIRTVPVR